MHPIHRCPDELWLKIFAFACTDGGRNGRAIALTCKSFADISSTVRLHSVDIASDYSLVALCALLPSIPVAQRAVRHLLIGPNLQKEERTVMNKNTMPTFSRELKGEVAELQALQDTLYGPSDNQSAAMDPTRIRAEGIRSIIALTAPTLKTLAVCSTGWHVKAHGLFPLIPFPALQDLTLPNLCLPHRAADIAQSSLLLPALRRLHLYPSSSNMAYIASLCPELVALRMSGLNQDDDLPGTIAFLCNIPFSSEDPDFDYYLRRRGFSSSVRLSKVKGVIAAATEWFDSGECGTGSIMHAEMVHGFRELERVAQAGDGPTVVFRPEIQEYYLRLREDWQDAVEGGDGCWAT